MNSAGDECGGVTEDLSWCCYSYGGVHGGGFDRNGNERNEVYDDVNGNNSIN